MRTLLDTPTDDEIALLRAIADGYAAGGDRWPVWQYVARRVDATVDAARVLIALPTWKHSYRYVTGLTNGRPPNPAETVRLTAAGMFHAGRPATNSLLAAFMGALAVAEDAQRAAEPMPTAATTVVLHDGQLTQQAVMRSGSAVSEAQLYELLQHEPATWTGLASNGDSWQWDVTQLNLRPYRTVTTSREYLTALEATVGEPPVATVPVVSASMGPQEGTRMSNVEPTGLDPRNVFVIHGRNAAANEAMFAFLRSIDLNPIEWTAARSMTKKGSP